MRRRSAVIAAVSSVAPGLSEAFAVALSPSMTPSTSEQYFNRFLSERGLAPERASVAELCEAALLFYALHRASRLAPGPESDMLLVQWGVFDWGDGEHFEFDLTRQFMSAGMSDDETISQLHCTAYFAPTVELRRIGASNRWCSSPAALGEFAQYVHRSEAYQSVCKEVPKRTEIRWERI